MGSIFISSLNALGFRGGENSPEAGLAQRVQIDLSLKVPTSSARYIHLLAEGGAMRTTPSRTLPASMMHDFHQIRLRSKTWRDGAADSHRVSWIDARRVQIRSFPLEQVALTANICMQNDLRVDRFLLLHGSYHRRLAEYVMQNIRDVSPETEIILYGMGVGDAWDFEVRRFTADCSRHSRKEACLSQWAAGPPLIWICRATIPLRRDFPKRVQKVPASLKAVSKHVTLSHFCRSAISLVARRFP